MTIQKATVALLTMTFLAGSLAPATTFAATSRSSTVKKEKTQLESNVFVTPNGLATVKQPKGWTPTVLLDIQKSSLQHRSVTFFTDPKTGTILSVTVWGLSSTTEDASSPFSIMGTGMEDVIKFIENLYTTDIKDLAPKLKLLGFDTKNADIHGKLLSKKPVTILGARGYELAFDRTDISGVWHIKYILVLKSGTYYEVAAKVLTKSWTKLKPVLDASFQTIQIP